MNERAGRSYKKIEKFDLVRLANLAKEDLKDLFTWKPLLGNLFEDRVLSITLCQGAALHYLNVKNGIKDIT